MDFSLVSVYHLIIFRSKKQEGRGIVFKMFMFLVREWEQKVNFLWKK